MSRPSFILPPGSMLGGYEIEDVVGVGGMAVVYRALQVSLGRRVALKVLNPRLAADSTFRERFRREGALVATLDHPGVIPVYDSGEVDGRLYLAMRLVDGETLAEQMADGLSVAEALPLLSAVGAALDAAHETGLLHRDVKPQNILISTAGHVYLADFGVAKGAGASNLTATQGFLGSVNYVAPEQIRGGEIGPAADVYALAIVAYECLTGRTPFARDTEAAVIHAHLSDEPPVLTPAGDRWSEAASVALAAGLEKDPAQRSSSASAFMRGLQQALHGAPADLLTRIPAFPPGGVSQGNASQSAAGAAAGVDAVAVPGGRARVAPGAPAGVAAGHAPVAEPLRAVDAAAPPVPGAAPVLPVDDEIEVSIAGATVHDRRRSEFLPDAPKRTKADRFYARAPWVVLVAAIAVPVAVAALTGDKPIGRTDVGAASVQLAKGWQTKTKVKLTTAQTAGLAFDGATAVQPPKSDAVVVAGTLAKGSGLAPQSLGKGEAASRIEVPGGTLRQWTVSTDKDVRRIAIAGSGSGAVAVVCTGATKIENAACDEVLGTLKADDGKLVADPDPAIATTVATALKDTASARKTALAIKNRAARASQAHKIAAAYSKAAASVASIDANRQWDRDLIRLESGLTSAARAFVSFEKAADAKDTSRDQRASGVLKDADASIDTALGRLQRRGYDVKGLSKGN